MTLSAGDPGTGGLGFAGLTAAGASPKDAWEAIRDRASSPETQALLETMRASPHGAAALETARSQWAAQGLAPPWEPAIVPASLAEAGTDPAAVPAGTTASKCAACGEIRLSYPADRTDEWKHHFDYCEYPVLSDES